MSTYENWLARQAKLYPRKDECAHCGESIIHFVSEVSNVWLHVGRTHAIGAESCLGAPRVAEPVND